MGRKPENAMVAPIKNIITTPTIHTFLLLAATPIYLVTGMNGKSGAPSGLAFINAIHKIHTPVMRKPAVRKALLIVGNKAEVAKAIPIPV
ncbi:hypothetical protein MTHERMOG20_03210 [Moorella thermoacetica]|nr:hypothetical protein MTHERMOG20_03210 [Moorella thermoacetica]